MPLPTAFQGKSPTKGLPAPLAPPAQTALTSGATSFAPLLYNGLVAGRGAGVARTFGVGEAGGSNPLVPTSFFRQFMCLAVCHGYDTAGDGSFELPEARQGCREHGRNIASARSENRTSKRFTAIKSI